jgi:hypothetical protein
LAWCRFSKLEGLEFCFGFTCFLGAIANPFNF